MMNNGLTKEELIALTIELGKLETPMYIVYRKFNSGFSEATMFDFDDEIIDVELNFGVDGERVYTEQYKIDRKTMKIID